MAWWKKMIELNLIFYFHFVCVSGSFLVNPEPLTCLFDDLVYICSNEDGPSINWRMELLNGQTLDINFNHNFEHSGTTRLKELDSVSAKFEVISGNVSAITSTLTLTATLEVNSSTITCNEVTHTITLPDYTGFLPSSLSLFPHGEFKGIYNFTAQWESCWNQFQITIEPNTANESGVILVMSTDANINQATLYLKKNVTQNISILICPSMTNYSSKFSIDPYYFQMIAAYKIDRFTISSSGTWTAIMDCAGQSSTKRNLSYVMGFIQICTVKNGTISDNNDASHNSTDNGTRNLLIIILSSSLVLVALALIIIIAVAAFILRHKINTYYHFGKRIQRSSNPSTDQHDIYQELNNHHFKHQVKPKADMDIMIQNGPGEYSTLLRNNLSAIINPQQPKKNPSFQSVNQQKHSNVDAVKFDGYYSKLDGFQKDHHATTHAAVSPKVKLPLEVHLKSVHSLAHSLNNMPDTPSSPSSGSTSELSHAAEISEDSEIDESPPPIPPYFGEECLPVKEHSSLLNLNCDDVMLQEDS